ncbi:MAG: hypothetical protein ACHQ52_08130 [Candidatus Eisenbacteria bacterium]
MLSAVSNELHLCQDLDHADAVTAVSPPPGAPTSGGAVGIVDRLEGLLDDLPESEDGPILDRRVIRSYYRATFYSGLRTIADHLLFALSSVPAAEAFAQDLGDSCHGAGEEFRRWLVDMADLKAGRDVSKRLAQDLSSMPHFGCEMLDLGYDAVSRSSRDGTGNQGLVAARTLVDRLDGRPSGVRSYGWAYRFALFDPLLADTVDDAMAHIAHPADVTWWSWWCGMTADTTTLLRLAGDRDRTIEERSRALEALDALPMADSIAVAGLHRALMTEAPWDYEAVDRYAAFLAAHGQGDAARAALTSWLDRSDRSNRAFDEIRARDRLADLYRRDGMTAMALDVIQPAALSWKFSALATAARIEDDLGHADAALRIAEAAWKRYPDSDDAKALVVRLLWRHGRDDDAAAALRVRGDLLDVSLWRDDLVPVLRERFADHPDDIARALAPAFRAGDELGEGLQVLATELDRAGDARLAFAVESRVRVHTDNAWIVMVGSYRYLRESAGAEAARRWMDAQTQGMTDDSLGRLLTTAFGEGEDALLWDVRWPGTIGDDSEFLWLLRAAASRRHPVLDPARRHDLRAHFATAAGGHYHMLGRFMLGLESESATHAEAATTRAASETDYYLGFAAEQEGRITDAARWYSRCAALNMRRNGEDYWARRVLAQWATSGRTVERIEVEARSSARRRATAGRDTGAI